jgi:hypothetical protein
LWHRGEVAGNLEESERGEEDVANDEDLKVFVPLRRSR